MRCTEKKMANEPKKKKNTRNRFSCPDRNRNQNAIKNELCQQTLEANVNKYINANVAKEKKIKKTSPYFNLSF